LTTNNFYRNEADAIAGINAVYETFSRNFNYYQFNFPVTLDVWTDIMNGRGSWTPAGNFELNTVNLGRYGGNWNIMYNSINNANMVLKYVPDIDMDNALKARILGEAHFLRALSYYHLVRLYGAVPLRIEPSEDVENVAKPRESVDAVYDVIISDLTTAGDGRLPNEYPEGEIGRVTHWAAKTLLADVYLTRENWPQAASLAKEVIDGGGFSLERDLDDIYSPTAVTSSEEIFSIKFAQIAGFGTGIHAYLHVAGAGYSSGGAFWVFIGEPRSPFFDNWDDADPRKTFNLYSGEDTVFLNDNRPILFKKYIDSNADGGFGHGNDYPVLRYPDALLIFAEADAMANNGPTAEAYEMANKVRRRGYGLDVDTPAPGVDLPTGMTADEFREAIFNERSYEFCLEAKRWYDMKRMGPQKVQELVEAAGDTYSDKILFWPIPQQEIDNNEAISQSDQNPGW